MTNKFQSSSMVPSCMLASISKLQRYLPVDTFDTLGFTDATAVSKVLPYLQVPSDFDAGCIAEVDDSSADKLAQTLAIAVMERTDALRHQVCRTCPSPLPPPPSVPHPHPLPFLAVIDAAGALPYQVCLLAVTE